MKKFKFLILFPALLVLFSCNEKEVLPDYPVTPVPFTRVTVNDGFWLPAIIRNSEVTIPIAFRQSEESGRIANFAVAGGIREGTFHSKYPFDDSDVFKIIEGASYALMIRYDASLDEYLDSLIYMISLAQEEDGYLYTNRTILGDSAHEMAGKGRWENVSLHSHELYNAGHLYEAAVAHYQATGKKNLLEVAMKNAGLICREFGPGKIERYPGHQEIEIGLVKLYRVTGDRKYLDQAKFFLDVRGPGGWEYNQAHLKPADQTEPVGHAVRAMYMYAGMADVAALAGDTAYIRAIGRIWDNLTGKKYYITGGVGQTGENEGFGPDYFLPNLTAYCETCASIAFVLWNYRLFLLHGDAKYMDVLERTLYNALIAGVSRSGDHFFYPNPLESDGRHKRKEWFGCACCPSNITRFLPSVPGYIFAQKEKNIYINLFISAETDLIVDGVKTNLKMESALPWEGKVLAEVNPDKPLDISLLIRVPGWAGDRPVPGDLYRFKDKLSLSVSVLINGEAAEYVMNRGYAVISRRWKKGDKLEIGFPMEVRRIIAHDSVKEDSGRFALQYGPLVYCVEDKDHPDTDIHSVVVLPEPGFRVESDPAFYGGANTILFRAVVRGKQEDTLLMKAIPYYLWANRGPGNMRVWLPCQ
ncbi:MAG: glycoside hydrolase family 127 protein [Bacteroidales bacterium]|nr:glycoside hydrolase family 127 protein [Bacteroidales bacterium]